MDTLYVKDSPFTVVDNLTVPSGIPSFIEPGCIIRFKPGLGLTVSGNLKALGTSESPIVFTSSNDLNSQTRQPANAQTADPMPFDWSGITFSGSTDSELKHCYVKYSTTGITSDMDITLDSVWFSQNGEQDLSIKGQVIKVESGSPYIGSRHGVSSVSLDTTTSSKDSVEANHEPPFVLKPNRRKYALIGTGLVAVTGGVLGFLYYLNHVEREVPPTPGEPDTIPDPPPPQ